MTLETFIIPDRFGASSDQSPGYYLARGRYEVDEFSGRTTFHDWEGVGRKVGYWRSLMEARLASARLLKEGEKIDAIIMVSGKGRKEFDPYDPVDPVKTHPDFGSW